MNKLSHYLAPILISMTPACTAQAPEGKELVHAQAPKAERYTRDISSSLENFDVADSLCQTANNVWATINQNLICEVMTPEALETSSSQKIVEALKRLDQIFRFSTVTPVSDPLSSSSFDAAYEFDLKEKDGTHHHVYIFTDKYQVIVHIYLDSHEDTKKGQIGEESYHLSFSNDTVEMNHMTHGQACINCNIPTFDFNTGESCGQADSIILAPSGIYSSQRFSNTKKEIATSKEVYEILCEQKTNAVEVTSCLSLGTKSEVSCHIDDVGQKHQSVIQSGPIEAEKSKSLTANLFAYFKSIMQAQGISIADWE